MTQLNIYLDDNENEIVEQYSKIWNVSKPDTIKKILKIFGNDKGGNHDTD